jgi:hypothetical protein
MVAIETHVDVCQQISNPGQLRNKQIALVKFKLFRTLEQLKQCSITCCSTRVEDLAGGVERRVEDLVGGRETNLPAGQPLTS